MDDNQKALKYSEDRNNRLAKLNEHHIAPLTEYVEELRALRRGEVPFFDPMDGGVEARILFVLQKPGKRTLEGIHPPRKTPGSGFISRNNDDETAKNTFELLAKAGIPRDQTLLWNIIPWFNERNVSDQEIEEGAAHLRTLIKMLPNLKVMVAVGDKAWAGLRYVNVPRNVLVRKSPHPSPRTVNKWPEKREEILKAWTEAYHIANT